MRARWILGLVSFLLSACPPPAPVPIDCAGQCGIGAPCDSADDCVFGACASVCTAPVEGPAPTGPVAVTISPAGTVITVVTDERVQLELVVPAGAVRADVPLTLTPRTPTGAGLVDVLADTPGAVFLAPVTVTLTLPPSVPAPPDLWLSFRANDAEGVAGDGAELIPIAVADATGAMSTQVSFLGNPNRAAPTVPLPGALTSSDWQRFAFFAAQEPLDRLLPALTQLLEGLLREGRAADAAALTHVIDQLVRLAVHTNEQQFVTFVQDVGVRTCARLQAELEGIDTAVPECVEDVRAITERVASFTSVIDGVSGLAVEDCPEAATAYDVLAAMMGRTAQLIANEEADGRRDLWLACECRATIDNEDHPLFNTCRRAGFALQSLEEWDVILGITGGLRSAFDPLHTLGDHAEAVSLGGVLTPPIVDHVRGLAFDECADAGDMSYLGSLAPRIDEPGGVITDAQHCASALTVTVKDSQGTTLETGSVPNIAAPGEVPAALALTAVRGSTLEVRGPVGTLLCRAAPAAAETVLDDIIRIDLVHPNGTVVAGDTRQANQARTLLVDPGGFDVDVDTALTALGIGAGDPASFGLRLTRASSGCGGLYDAPAVLFDVGLAEPTPLEATVKLNYAVYDLTAAPICFGGMADFQPVPQEVSSACTGTVRLERAGANAFEFSADLSTADPWVQLDGRLELTFPRDGTIRATTSFAGFSPQDGLTASAGSFTGGRIACDATNPAYCEGSVAVAEAPVVAGTELFSMALGGLADTGVGRSGSGVIVRLEFLP